MELENKIKDLLSQMTLEEKASLCSGEDMWRTKGLERLGLPRMMMCDGPNGLRKQEGAADHLGVNDSIEAVCFPSGSAVASSYDPELYEEMGHTLGQECRAVNIQMLLGPAVNIKRSPLCGRNFEYLSEDPYLAGQMAAAYVKGVESEGVGTSIKHFAANNQEARRMTCSSNMTERTLREIYLPPYEKAVKESHPASVMCSYNRINGVFASENHHLMTEILRDDWGFDGMVVTDWGAINDRVKGLEAGVDLEMPGSGGLNDRQIVEAVQSGRLDESVLDRAVERLLRWTLRAHFAKPGDPALDHATGHAEAVRIATQSAVLLENNGVLPLQADRKVAYIGAFAAAPRYQGGGSAHVHAHRVTSAWETAREKGRRVSYTEGFTAGNDPLDPQALQAALDAAAAADAAVIFAGLPECFESEGFDRKDLELPAAQNQLIAQICKVQPNTVVVLHNGSPVRCPWAKDVAAVLEMYLGGEGVGEAADALLWGEANPCGRLAETFPLQLEDTPASLTYGLGGDNAEYTEGVFVGYRYYDRKNRDVRWPFGYGLSYTTFAVSDLKLSADHLGDGEQLKATVTVRNTGSRAGRDVVQLYVQNAPCEAPRPVRELKGFAKVSLEPGESKTVEMVLDSRSFSYWEEQIGDWYAAPGVYTICVGHSSRDLPLSAQVTVSTQAELPLVVDLNTCMGDIYRNKYAAAALKQMMSMGVSNKDKQEQRDKQRRNEADNPEMMKAVMQYMPLRALKSFVKLDEATLNAMIANINNAIRSRSLPDTHAEKSPKDKVLAIREMMRQADETRLRELNQDNSDLELLTEISYLPDGDALHTLEVCWPKGAQGPLPTIIDIHGGALIHGTKELNRNFACQMARSGFAVIGINYRLIPEVTLHEQVADVAAALRFVANELHCPMCDLSRLYLVGDSAGGCLALYGAAINGDETVRAAFGEPPCGLAVRGLGLISPMAHTRRSDSLGWVTPFLDTDPPHNPNAAPYVNDPMLCIRDTMPPVFVITSAEDMLRSDSVELHQTLQDRGVDCELMDWPKGESAPLEHVFSVSYPQKEESRTAIRAMLDFFEKH